MNTTATAAADFAMRLFNRLAATNAAENAFLSPFSIQVALAMVAVGAKGETRRELTDLIGAPESVAEQNNQYAEWIGAFQRVTAGSRIRQNAGLPDDRPHSGECGYCQLSIANALWVQQGYRFNPDYKKAIAEFYDGAFNEVNFHSSPAQAVKTINAWVEDKTAGKIRELIQRDLVTEATRLILTNAIYFKGQWDSEFDKNDTLDEDWHSINGVRKVPMMQQRRGFLYHEDNAVQAVDLPFVGQHLAMLIVLPRQTDGLAALQSRWSAANMYRHVTDSLVHEKPIIVSIPRFKLETEYKLKPVLVKMGAALAVGAQADFSGMGQEPLSISEVIHKAFFEINEEGAEAAAATGVVMRKSAVAQAKVFRADHPFLFFIRHRATNAVLFSGQLLEPT